MRNSLTRYTARHLRIKYLVQFILAGPVYHNALTNCATRVCCACADPPACVAEHYLTLRTGCSRGRTPKVVRPQQRKNPLPFPYFRSGRRSLVCVRLSNKGKVGVQRGRETAGVYPLVRPRGVSADVYPLVPLPGRQDFLASQATLCRSAPERKRGTLLPRSVPLCAYYWFLFS